MATVGGQQDVAGDKKPNLKEIAAGGCGCLVLLIVALMVLGAFVGDPSSSTENDVAEKNETANTASAVADRAGGNAHSEASRQELRNLHAAVLRASKPCDEASAPIVTLGERLGSGRTTPVDAYGELSEARERCLAASLVYAGLQPTTNIPPPARGKVVEALRQCQVGSSMRAELMEAMMRVVDGDARPSQVHEAKQKADGIQAHMLLCIGGMMGEASRAGIDITTLPTDVE